MRTHPHIAVCIALLAFAQAVASGQTIRAENKPASGGPSANVGVLEPANSLEKERQRMIRGCERHLKKAEKAFDAGHYGPACRSLRSAKNLCVTRELASRWGALGTQLERIGRERLDEAEKRYAREEYVEALDGFRRVLAVFTGLPVAKAARLRISEVESDPEVQAAIKEVTAARMFAHLARMVRTTTTAPATSPAAAPAVTAGAIMALKDDRVLRAIDTLDSIIRTCRGAPTAGKARELRRRLRSDPKADARLTRLIRGRLATQALNKARTYHQAGMHDKAVALYRGVIQDFGGTARAAEAAVLLGALEVASPGR